MITETDFYFMQIALREAEKAFEINEVQKNGELVTATITYIPICSGTKIKYFMKFVYAGQEFDKKVGCGFAETHKVGETIKLRHKDDTDIFLFENERKETEFISTGILAVLGIAFIVIGVKRK